MGTKKMILVFLAFYFSCGFYQAKILPSDHKEAVVAEQFINNHNVDGDTRIVVNKKYGHAAEAHIVGGGRGSGGEVNGDGSRSPSNQRSRSPSNFIPIYAANAHHNRHRGAASSHRSHNGYLALFAATLFACLCT